MSSIFDLFKKIENNRESDSSIQPISWLIVGLGNPGLKYDGTRHNTGFMALDAISKKCSFKIDKIKYSSLCGESQIANNRILFLKPQTLMNASGKAVEEAATFYKIQPDHIIVISDDISLPVGKMRFRLKGSAGGHNGLKDIIAHLGSDNFPRLRVGIGEKPHPDYDLADWVLSSFSKDDKKTLEGSFDVAFQGLTQFMNGKVDEAVQTCNSYNPTNAKEEKA